MAVPRASEGPRSPNRWPDTTGQSVDLAYVDGGYAGPKALSLGHSGRRLV